MRTRTCGSMSSGMARLSEPSPVDSDSGAGEDVRACLLRPAPTPPPSARPRAASSGPSCRPTCAPTSSASAARRWSRPSRQTSGFTPGFASVLVCADGSRHFVKAASVKAQRAVRRLLPRGGPQARRAPARRRRPRDCCGTSTTTGWRSGIEYVDGRAPRRPWRPADLDAVLDALEVVADELTPPPADLDPRHGRGRLPAAGRHVGPRQGDAARPAPPRRGRGARGRLRRRRRAATRWSTPTSATTTCCVDGDGKVWICDWNWPVVGRRLDRHALHPDRAAGRRVDVESVLAASPADPRRTARDDRPRAGAAGRLLPQVGRRPGAADVTVPARPPALAGRRLLALAVRAAGLGVSRAGPRFGCSSASAVVFPLACPAPDPATG